MQLPFDEGGNKAVVNLLLLLTEVLLDYFLTLRQLSEEHATETGQTTAGQVQGDAVVALVRDRLELVLPQPVIDGMAVLAQVVVELRHVSATKQIAPCLTIRHGFDPLSALYIHQLDEISHGVVLPALPYHVALSSRPGVLIEEIKHGQVLIDCAREGHGLILIVQLKTLTAHLIDQPLLGQLVVAHVSGSDALQETVSHRQTFVVVQQLFVLNYDVANNVGSHLHHDVRQLNGYTRSFAWQQPLVKGCHDNILLKFLHPENNSSILFGLQRYKNNEK